MEINNLGQFVKDQTGQASPEILTLYAVLRGACTVWVDDSIEAQFFHSTQQIATFTELQSFGVGDEEALLSWMVSVDWVRVVEWRGRRGFVLGELDPSNRVCWFSYAPCKGDSIAAKLRANANKPKPKAVRPDSNGEAKAYPFAIPPGEGPEAVKPSTLAWHLVKYLSTQYEKFYGVKYPGCEGHSVPHGLQGLAKRLLSVCRGWDRAVEYLDYCLENWTDICEASNSMNAVKPPLPWIANVNVSSWLLEVMDGTEPLKAPSKSLGDRDNTDWDKEKQSGW